MFRAQTLAVAYVLSSVGGVSACQMASPFPDPSWEQQIDVRELVFIGTVDAIVPNAKSDRPDRVLFGVERQVKGAVGSTYEVMQGSGGDCGIPFEIGQRFIFAGDAIWDPTVLLSEPPTPREQQQLDYLSKFAATRQ